MYAQCSNICSCFTTDPKHGQPAFIVEFEKFTFVDSSDPQLAFDGADERWTLEESTSEIFNCSGKRVFISKGIVQT